jgi:[phosphatase 2A protein]-leucine-carboxy methyltransferase
VEEHKHTLTGGEKGIFEEPKTDDQNLLNQEGHCNRQWGILRTEMGGKFYRCHPLDLRQLPSLPSLDSLPGVESHAPTLIISECCLCYLEVDIARDVVKWFKDRIPSLGIVLYEPIGVDDAFGQMMVENLATRGIVMPTVQRYKTLRDQVDRLVELGFKAEEGGGGSDAETIKNIWETWVSEDERERVDDLEGLDEVEEWLLLARHYAVVWGWTEALQWDGPKPTRLRPSRT